MLDMTNGAVNQPKWIHRTKNATKSWKKKHNRIFPLYIYSSNTNRVARVVGALHMGVVYVCCTPCISVQSLFHTLRLSTVADTMGCLTFVENTFLGRKSIGAFIVVRAAVINDVKSSIENTTRLAPHAGALYGAETLVPRRYMSHTSLNRLWHSSNLSALS